MKTDQSVYINQPVTFSWLILFIILLAPLITVIDVFIMNVSLPTIQAFFKASDAGVQGVIASYLVGYSVFLITGSRAGDHFGRKKVFIWGLMAFTVTSALCGMAASTEQLVIFRFFQGISAGFAVPQTVTLIQLNFKLPEHRNKALGYYGITLGIASVLGQFLGGYFVTSHLMKESWRLIFLINVPIGIVAVILAAMFIPESKIKQETKFDIGGVVLLTLGLSALVFPIIQGRELNWPLWTLGLLIAAIFVLWFFLKNQQSRIKTGKQALVPMQLFKIRTFNLGLGMVFCYFAVFSSFLLTCALFLQTGHHINPLTSASYFIILGFSFMLSSHWAIKNGAKYGTKLLYISCILLISSFVIQLIWFNSSISLIPIISAFLLYGLGAGVLVPAFLKIALQDVPAEQAGLASGIYSTVQQFSSALGVSTIGGVFFYTVEHKNQDFNGGYQIALVCMILYVLIVMILLFAISKKRNTLAPFAG